jgi:hypothetical protein
MRQKLNTVRWADLRQQPVAVGQAVRSGDIFRVISPMPCVWKVFFAARATAPLNFPLFIRARFYIGVGSFTAEAPQDIAFNTTYLVELPAQSLALTYEVDPALAADVFQFGGTAAPLTPWEGLIVQVEGGEGVHGEGGGYFDE